jgi:hypothetical protein
VADTQSDVIYELGPGGGSPTIFSSSVGAPAGVTFVPGGNLAVTNLSGGSILSVTPGDSVSTLASGLVIPFSLASDGAGNLYLASFNNGTIVEIAPGGQPTAFASGLTQPYSLAFAPAAVPEPSAVTMTWTLAGMLVATVAIARHRKKATPSAP